MIRVGEKDETHIEVNGWSIAAREGSISDQETRKRLEEGCAQMLPEMYFGANALEFVHKDSGFRFEFSARDAFQNVCSMPPEEEVKVKAAQTWRADEKIAEHSEPVNWTFTNHYMGTIVRGGERKLLEWRPDRNGVEEGAIDYDLLQRRDPILWFREVVLFEDELADSGLASLSVKTRVMPSCFYSLQRFWVRVDDVMLRMHETRLFHRFGAEHLVLEYSVREDNVEALRQRGLGGDTKRFKDPNKFASHLTLRQRGTVTVPLREGADTGAGAGAGSGSASASAGGASAE